MFLLKHPVLTAKEILVLTYISYLELCSQYQIVLKQYFKKCWQWNKIIAWFVFQPMLTTLLWVSRIRMAIWEDQDGHFVMTNSPLNGSQDTRRIKTNTTFFFSSNICSIDFEASAICRNMYFNLYTSRIFTTLLN